MDQEKINAVTQTVIAQHPYLSEISPEILSMDDGNTQLIYKGEAKTESGFSLPIIIRVVVDHSGEIVKMTSSR